MIVADASALLELVLRTGRAERVGARTLAVGVGDEVAFTTRNERGETVIERGWMG